ARDYDEEVQEILGLATKIYRCQISAVNPYPDHALEVQWAQFAWGEACKQLDVNVAATPVIVKIITKRTSQVRGELKGKIKPLVESLYGFEGGSARTTIIQNRERAENLKDDYAFVYKLSRTLRKGMYEHPIIQKAINAMWFVNKHDEGVRLYPYFNPISIETFAFVLAAIECGIDEWGTGTRTEVHFTADDYRPVYETHKASLEAFDTFSDDAHRVLLKIRTKLHNEARYSIFYHH
ncbi:uncharacterized protein B0H18DRAFT_896253, partial [Fomitopsis serialis]|uniref:uncharacterized protein n=1 Tax=Fomitopsis serialis TaxID=139415 RepID=UPI0020076212